MKKLYVLLAGSLLAATAFSQTTFWTEDFGTGCNRGQLATAYTGTNGAWMVAQTGTNGNVANNWYVSATASNTGAGNCSDNCIFSSVTDAALHVSNTTIIIPAFLTVNADTGASYFTGGFSSFGYVATTNVRVESPIINCTGHTTIGISFLYFENGQATSDDAQLVYSPDGGMTWTAIDPLAKTTGCAVGQWTAITVALPASADNNTAVKIGFSWTNNDDAQGTDPSFAVDGITLTDNFTTGLVENAASLVNLFVTEHGVISVDAKANWNLVSMTDLLGRPVNAAREGSLIRAGEMATGVYLVTLEVNGVRVVRKVFLQ